MCRLQKITVRNSQPHVFVLLWQAATSHSLHTEAALYILVVLTGAWIVCSLSQLTRRRQHAACRFIIRGASLASIKCFVGGAAT
jgi:hypothetical protein